MLEEIDALSDDLLRAVLDASTRRSSPAIARAIADLRAAVEASDRIGPRSPSRLHAGSTIAIDHQRCPARPPPAITEGLTTHGSIPGRAERVRPDPRRRSQPSA